MKVWKGKEGKWITLTEFLSRWKDGIQKITPLQQLQTQMLGMLLIFAGILFGLVIAFRTSLWWLFIILLGSMIVFLSQIVGILQRYIILKAVKAMMDGGDILDEPKEKKGKIYDEAGKIDLEKVKDLPKLPIPIITKETMDAMPKFDKVVEVTDGKEGIGMSATAMNLEKYTKDIKEVKKNE